MKKRNFELRDRDFAACCLETARRAGFNNERLGAAPDFIIGTPKSEA